MNAQRAQNDLVIVSGNLRIAVGSGSFEYTVENKSFATVYLMDVAVNSNPLNPTGLPLSEDIDYFPVQIQDSGLIVPYHATPMVKPARLMAPPSVVVRSIPSRTLHHRKVDLINPLRLTLYDELTEPVVYRKQQALRTVQRLLECNSVTIRCGVLPADTPLLGNPQTPSGQPLQVGLSDALRLQQLVSLQFSGVHMRVEIGA